MLINEFISMYSLLAMTQHFLFMLQLLQLPVNWRALIVCCVLSVYNIPEESPLLVGSQGFLGGQL